MTLEANDFARRTLEEIAAGGSSAADLAAAAAARMDRFDRAVNAVISRAPAAAGERASGGAGALRGAPVAIADNIMVRGVAATCAGEMLTNFVPPRDATVIEKLTAAGAVVTAKTNMDEFGMGSSGETSARGPAKNPWRLTLTAGGGGAGGAAAVVAYGGAAGALAVDTSGAVRQAAAFCGLVGMKPTYGRVSRSGAAALASSMDQIGPITRTARDNALLFDIITGPDPLDSTSRSGPGGGSGSCLAIIDDGAKGLRVGWSPALLDRAGVAADVAEAYRKAVELCRAGGAEVSEIKLPLLDEGAAAAAIITCCEASANMTRLDGMRYGVVKDGADPWQVYSRSRGEGFGDEVKRRVMLGAWALSKDHYEDVFLRAARVRRLVADGLKKILSSVDAVILPVCPAGPAKIGVPGTGPEAFRADVFTVPASLSGLPAISYPVGLAGGLPSAAQAVAGSFREDVLYRIARAAEAAAPLAGAGEPWTKSLPEGAE